MRRALSTTHSMLELANQSPILLTSVILIRDKLGAPDLFRQLRRKRDGKPFERRLCGKGKFELNVKNVGNRILLLDMKSVALMIKTVIKRDGISTKGVANMTSFRGSK